MKEYIAIHKHCGMTIVIQGYDKYDALRKANLQLALWTIQED